MDDDDILISLRRHARDVREAGGAESPCTRTIVNCRYVVVDTN